MRIFEVGDIVVFNRNSLYCGTIGFVTEVHPGGYIVQDVPRHSMSARPDDIDPYSLLRAFLYRLIADLRHSRSK